MSAMKLIASGAAFPLASGTLTDRLIVATRNKEVRMATFHTPLPHQDFTVTRVTVGQDYEENESKRRMRVIETSDGHKLQIRSKNGYVSINQAPFHATWAAIDWATRAYKLGDDFEHRSVQLIAATIRS
jgi:hypothetical protein